jgi:hypothetical protein
MDGDRYEIESGAESARREVFEVGVDGGTLISERL